MRCGTKETSPHGSRSPQMTLPEQDFKSTRNHSIFIERAEDIFLQHLSNVTTFASLLIAGQYGAWSESLHGGLGSYRGIHNDYGSSHHFCDCHSAWKPDGHLGCSVRSKQKSPESIYSVNCQPCCDRPHSRSLGGALVHTYTLSRVAGFVHKHVMVFPICVFSVLYSVFAESSSTNR